MGRSSVVVCGALVIVASACGKQSSSSGAGSGSAIAGAKQPIVAAPVATDAAIVVDAGVAMPDPSAVADLPVFSVEPAAKPSDGAVAEKLNVAALAAHKKNDWAKAFEKYGDALKKDPGNILVRYNLASAYHSSGDDAKALALLAQFKQPSCRACNAILRAAKTDPEWAGLVENAQFKAIVDGVVAEQVDLPKLTGRVLAALESKKVDDVLPYVHPHDGFREGTAMFWDDASAIVPQKMYYGETGFHDFVDHALPASMTNTDPDGNAPCDKANCCSGGKPIGRQAGAARVCYSMLGGLPFMREIDLYLGPPI